MITLQTRYLARHARNIAAGLAVLSAAVLAEPGSATAASPNKVSDRLDRIAYEVERIPDIRGLRHQDRAIDRLQEQLTRLDRITDGQRGRQARANAHRIDRLQHRLARMEYRIEARLDRNDRPRHGYWWPDPRRYGFDDRRPFLWR